MGNKNEDGEKLILFDGVLEAMPLIAKELVAGGVAGGFAKTVVAPLDRVKILFQVFSFNFPLPIFLILSYSVLFSMKFRFISSINCSFLACLLWRLLPVLSVIIEDG